MIWLLISWPLLGFVAGVFITFMAWYTEGNDITRQDVIGCLVIAPLYGWILVLLAIFTVLSDILKPVVDWFKKDVVLLKGRGK